MDQVLAGVEAVAQVHGEVAGLLHLPCPVRAPSHPGKVESSGAVLDEHQHVQPLEQHRLHHQEVTGDDRVCLSGQELPPGRPFPPRRRIVAGVIGKTSGHRWRFTSRDNAVSQSRSA
jgi:hypothetical protein